jgi:ATP-dependent DNA helicase RecG
MLLKLSAVQKTVKLLWVAYLSCFTIYSDFYLTHQQLCSQTFAHAREVTLALVKLERTGIISSSGEHKGKVYHKPNVEIPTPDNASGQFLAENVFINKPNEANELEEHPELSPDIELAESEWQELEHIAEPVKGNSRRAGKEAINQVIIKLCSDKVISLTNLSILLDMKPDTLRKNYLNPLVACDMLRLAYPTTRTRNHPQQAYTANNKSN